MRSRKDRRKISDDAHSTETPILRFRFLETQWPGLPARAELVEYDQQTKCLVDSGLEDDSVYDLYDKIGDGQSGEHCGDAFGQNFHLAGEVCKAALNISSGFYEIVGSEGLRRIGKAVGNIQVGQEGDVKVWHSPASADCTGAESSETITDACLKMGGDVQDGELVFIHYHFEFKKWFILRVGDPASALATIVFTMLTDRTRETVGGLSVGRADVLITDKVGLAGDGKGSVVEVIFADSRWLESVKGCQGIADYIYDPVKAAELGQANPYFWIVKECQGQVAGFWARTLADRAAGAPDQDVLVEVVQLVGHANDDFPPTAQASQSGSCGNITIGCRVDPLNPLPDDPINGKPRGRWAAIQPCGEGCGSTYEDFIGLPCHLESPDITASCSGEPTQENPTQTTVRYLAGTFPRMVSGALCFVLLDNDIANTTDNSTMRYYVEYSQELVDAISGVLSENACKTNFTVSGVQNDSPWPHNQPIPASMLPLTIHNTRHAGIIGSSWAATWSDAEQAYVCIDMESYEVSLATGITSSQQGDCTTLAVSKINAYVELCSTGSSSAAFLSYKTAYADKITDFIEQQCSLTIQVERQQVYAFCAAATNEEIFYPMENRTVIDECLTVGCDANGVYGLQAHFTTICVIGPRSGEWRNCIPIVRCDGEETCAPQVPETPPEPPQGPPPEEPPPPQQGPLE